MSEWPENQKGLDMNWKWANLLKIGLNWTLPVLLLIGLGLAQAIQF